MAITRRRVSVGLACGAAAALVPLAVVYACSPLAVVEASTYYGAPGSTATVTVKQAYGGYNLTIAVAGQTEYSTVVPGAAKSYNTVSAQVTIPAVPPGTYTINATVSNPIESFTAHATFEVTAPASSTGSSPSRSAVTRPESQSRAPSANGTANSNAVADAATAGDPQAAVSTAAGPLGASDLADRIAARDGYTPPLGAAPVQTKGTAPVAFAQPETQGNPVMTGLIVGVITLAVGLPVLLLGFATVTALQRRATRTYTRNDSKKNRDRLS